MKRLLQFCITPCCLFTAVFAPCAYAHSAKTYKHASMYQVGVLDRNVEVYDGQDQTIAPTDTAAKLNSGSEDIHIIYTHQGIYRVEAPINKGLTILSAMADSPGPVYRNKWFLDNVAPGTKVLFAAQCRKANRKHPYRAVRCEFWFPDPESTSHEYATPGDYLPNIPGNGSNIHKAASVLCGTTKLNAATAAEICGNHQ